MKNKAIYTLMGITKKESKRESLLMNVGTGEQSVAVSDSLADSNE